MAEKRELLKVVCSAVVLVKEGDKVLREDVAQGTNCYSLEEMSEYYANARAAVDEMNEANKPNRKTRRASQ